VYTFVSEEEGLYIGMSRIPLRDQICQYQRRGPTRSRNIQVNSAITDLLQSGASVLVYALPDRRDMEDKGFHISLAEGIENSVIREIQPR